jgi:hypothetical protein
MHDTDSDSDRDNRMSVDPPATSGFGGNKSNLELPCITDGPIFPDVDSSIYMYRDIPFNLGTNEEMKRHQDNLAQLVLDLKR